MRARFFAFGAVAILLGSLGWMVLASPVAGSVDPQTMQEARSKGWRPAGAPSESTTGPLDLVRIRSETHERYHASVLVGKFFVVSVKSPVWVPDKYLRGTTDDYVRQLAAENGVELRPVAGAPQTGPDGSLLLEYTGVVTQGSPLGADEVGVLARVIPCDPRGNVVVAAGFAAKSVTSGGLIGSSTTKVYDAEIKNLLVPAAACP